MVEGVRRDRRWLISVAREVAERVNSDALKGKIEGVRCRMPTRARATNTGGWAVTLGDLGKDQPHMEIWYDRFSGYPDRKLYAGLFSKSREPLESVKYWASRALWFVREVNEKDTEEGGLLHLTERLTRGQFNRPILEKYDPEETFLGIYDLTRETEARISPSFLKNAARFFLDIAAALPVIREEVAEIYPRIENRQLVVTHILRERDPRLAEKRKKIDGYRCQVCRFKFKDLYGELGDKFAESHHRLPLSKLDGPKRPSLDDLITVCSNCHQMLHRMSGEADDYRELQRIVRRHRR